ncbi:MAG: hypothetical protein R3284_04505 [Rubricoccaceae bacterium]|nr:hypothetical protein [Rubricoccaceae bacterium]
MRGLRILIALLAVLEGGWLLFDGLHGLMTGDYVTPSSGDYAGQLGPWATLVEAVGIAPRSSLMMGIHMLLGGAWMICVVGWLRKSSWAWTGMMVCAVAALWYLPFGTILSVLQIGLLVIFRRGTR